MMRAAILARVLVVLVGLLASSEFAIAQTVTDTLGRWGMLGTWALDCSQPPSRSNGYLSYVAKQGGAFHEREFGDARDSSRILSARMTANGLLEVRIDYTSISQIRDISFFKAGDGRIRSMSNRIVNGEYSIKDGNFVSNGNPSPWQIRCR